MLRPKGLPRFEPMFGVSPHTPELCGEADQNRPGDVDPRTNRVVPRKLRKRLRRDPKCPTCGGAISRGSSLVCMSRHCVAPDRIVVSGSDSRGALPYDRTDEMDIRRYRKEAEVRAEAEARRLEPTALWAILAESRGEPAFEIERRIADALQVAAGDAA